MKKISIIEALNSSSPAADVILEGWVRTRRDSKAFSFLELNDGSCIASIQIIADAGIAGYERIKEMSTGASLRVCGRLVASQGKQDWELQGDSLELLGAVDDSYPLQKKGHSPEFLRTIVHLRPRTNLFGAVFRTRSRMAAAVHQFFTQRDFIWLHSPIITASDCEGAGEMFHVTTLDPLREQKNHQDDFFGTSTQLTVSGQLEAECFASALGSVYTFGPTFRAENSNTTRHAAEFWMIEPEIAFCDLDGDMQLAEDFIRYLVDTMLADKSGDLDFFCKFIDKGLRERLLQVSRNSFARCSYTEAIEIMQKSKHAFQYPPVWGIDLQTEHERYLAEQHFESPVIVYNYPKTLKPFYMRMNDDQKTVRAMDVLVPGVGEIIGGSQREERLERLEARMLEAGMRLEDYAWYTDLRRYGSVPHAGFGLGFERLLMFVTGIQNIRDVLPFPRTPRNCAP